MNSRPLMLFDGACNLCHASVRWVLVRDSKGQFDFASLQSQVATDVLERSGFEGARPDSMVLVHEGRTYLRSDAAIAVGQQLGFPWSMGVVFKIVPRPLRNGVYAWIARNRYRWFGEREACDLPDPSQAERFLDAGEDPNGK